MWRILPLPLAKLEPVQTYSKSFRPSETFRKGWLIQAGVQHSVETEPFSLRAPPVLLRNLMHKQPLTTASPRNLDQSQFANL